MKAFNIWETGGEYDDYHEDLVATYLVDNEFDINQIIDYCIEQAGGGKHKTMWTKKTEKYFRKLMDDNYEKLETINYGK